jgi:hypothetical protein
MMPDAPILAVAQISRMPSRFQLTEAMGQLCDSAFAGLDSGPAMVECEKLPKMPNVAITIQGRAFTLRPDQYVLQVREWTRGSTQNLCEGEVYLAFG